MRTKTQPLWPLTLSTEQRVTEARERLPKIVDNLAGLFHLHEANRIISFSDALAKQVPRSYAANAFLVFQSTMLRGEMIRLCALWDPPKEARLSLPTVAALVDDEDVLAAIHTFSVENAKAGRLISDEVAEDPELTRWLEEMMVDNAVKGVEERDAQLRAAIAAIREIAGSDLLKAARDFRNTFLAHALTERRYPELATRYGDDRLLLEKTTPIVDHLYLAVCQSGFDWSGAKDMAKRYAEALWYGCIFKVLG